MFERALLLVGALTVGGCHPPPPTPVAAPSSAMGRFEEADLRREASEHLDRLGADAVARARLQERLDLLLVDARFQAQMRELGVQAVASIRFAEGGAIVKIARGSGTVDFVGGPTNRRLEVSAQSIGAQIGGSAAQGLILFLGLAQPDALAGTYSGKLARATVLTETTRDPTVFRHEVRGHLAYLVGISKGLTADAGVAELTLALP